MFPLASVAASAADQAVASTGGPCFPSLHKSGSHRPPFGWGCRFVGFLHGGHPALFAGSPPPGGCRCLYFRSRSPRTGRRCRGTGHPRADVRPPRGKTPPRHTDLCLERERGPGPGFRGGDGRGDAALWSEDEWEIPRGGGGDCVDDRPSGVDRGRVAHHVGFLLAMLEDGSMPGNKLKVKRGASLGLKNFPHPGITSWASSHPVPLLCSSRPMIVGAPHASPRRTGAVCCTRGFHSGSPGWICLPVFSGADVGLRFANPTYGFPNDANVSKDGAKKWAPVTACV